MPFSRRTSVRHGSFLAAVIVGIAGAAIGAAQSPGSVFRYQDVDQAWKVVQQTNRPMLLYVSMDKCHFCEKMVQDTLHHPEIAPSLDGLFVTTKLMRESKPELIQHLGVRAFPTTLVIAPSGALIAKIEGYADPKKFVTVLRPALAKHAAESQRTASASQEHAAERQ